MCEVGYLGEREREKDMLPDEICQCQRVEWLRCQAGYLVIVDADRGGGMGPWLLSGQLMGSSCKTSSS